MVDDPIAVCSVSGGKDSQETANVAIDRYGPDRVRLVMADTGHEHPVTMDFVTHYLPDALGLPIDIVRADFSRQIERKRRYIKTHWEYAGVPLARIDRALEVLRPTGNPYLDLCLWKGRFPSTKAQFCTLELKAYVLDAYIIDMARRTKQPVESWQGVRRDESRNRRHTPDRLPATLDRPWATVYPIAAMSASEVVALILARGQKLNPLYSLGMKRVGCMPCINVGKDELLEIAHRWPEEVARVREWEFLVGDASKRGATTFFTDDGGRPRGAGEPTYLPIDRVVAWAKTSRGGLQYDLERAIPSPECTSLYGLCE